MYLCTRLNVYLNRNTVEIALVIVFMILGIAFFILEIFFLPGISIGGIAGTLFVLAGIWFAFSNISSTAGWFTCVLGALVFVIAVWLFIKSRTLERLSLKTELESDNTDNIVSEIVVGDYGTTISRLAPMGRVIVNGSDYEAKAQDTLIDPNIPVVITGIENNTLIVAPLRK